MGLCPVKLSISVIFTYSQIPWETGVHFSKLVGGTLGPLVTGLRTTAVDPKNHCLKIAFRLTGARIAKTHYALCYWALHYAVMWLVGSIFLKVCPQVHAWYISLSWSSYIPCSLFFLKWTLLLRSIACRKPSIYSNSSLKNIHCDGGAPRNLGALGFSPFSPNANLALTIETTISTLG